MKNIIFDLDGTLADTSGDLIAAANKCFIDLGYGALLNPTIDKLTAFHGGRAMLKEGFKKISICLLYTSPSPRDGLLSRMPSSA